MKLTVTYYTLTKTDGTTTTRRDREQLERWAAAPISEWFGAELTEQTVTYFEGMPVQVHSYGAWRDGLVIAVRRITVEVRYARNKKGLQHVKRFTAESLRPMPRSTR